MAFLPNEVAGPPRATIRFRSERAAVGSCDRDILSGQSVIDRDRKVTPHLDPVFVPVRPNLGKVDPERGQGDEEPY